jgi:Fe-Mn family superoxide dismutase
MGHIPLILLLQCMKPGGGGAPHAGKLLDMITRDFGSYGEFRKEFTTAANTAFGSGWAWLVQTPSGLKVSSLTSNVQCR